MNGYVFCLGRQLQELDMLFDIWEGLQDLIFNDSVFCLDIGEKLSGNWLTCTCEQGKTYVLNP